MNHLMLPDGIDLSEGVAILRQSIRQAWEPQPRLKMSEVAERHLYLSPEYAPKNPGLVRFEQRPLLREIVDRLGQDDPVKTVVVRGPIQYGKTIILQAFLVDTIIYHPCPFLWVTDTSEKAELFSKDRFDRMVRDCPGLPERVAESKGYRAKDNTIKRKVFPGGGVSFTGAQAVTGLTSSTYEKAAIDEADDHRKNLSDSGSSIANAIGRQTDLEDIRKTAIVSSPKSAGESDIDQWHDRGDQRVWVVPCIHCGAEQNMLFDFEHDPPVCLTPGVEFRAGKYGLVWPWGHPDEAHYECVVCGGAWEDRHKDRFIPAGHWYARRPDLGESGTITSYSLNALYMPAGGYSFADFARDWESAVNRAKAGDLDEMRMHVNKRQARSFVEPSEALDSTGIKHVVDPDWGDVPAAAKVMTRYTDQQKDRLESMAVAWGPGWECWIQDYSVILSAPEDDDAWAKHDELVHKRYPTVDGRSLRPRASGVDRGDLWQKVLEYCQPRFRWGVYACKGVEGKPDDPIWDKTIHKSERLKKKKKKIAHYFHIRTVACKDEATRFLKVTSPSGPKRIHIPQWIRDKFPDCLEQLTSEKRTETKDNRGNKHVTWSKKVEGRPNEFWDCFLGNLAMAHNLVMQGIRLDAPSQAELTLEDPVQSAPSEPHEESPVAEVRPQPRPTTPAVPRTRIAVDPTPEPPDDDDDEPDEDAGLLSRLR